MRKLPLIIALSLISATSFSTAETDKVDYETAKSTYEKTIPTKDDAGKQKRLLEGKRMYEQVCYECHTSGYKDAPRLGNFEDWKEIRHYGKVALLESVIVGKGMMPRQGGSAERSEARYRLMVEYMLSTVNAENIQTTQETWDEAKLARHLSNGETLYNMVCSDCHATGANGAPKVADKAAWKPRYEKGLNALVDNVIRGHGNMLPLGGSAIKSIVGVREMVAYMLTTVGYEAEE